MFSETANRITGSINKQYDKVEYYFHLKKTNDSLMAANQALYDKLKQNFNLPDTLSRIQVDSIRVDSLMAYRRYAYISAKVVANSISSQANYIVLSGRHTPAFTEGMGVIDLNGNVVGRVVQPGKYPAVMSLLHKDSKQSGMLIKTGEAGTVIWEGKDPTELVLLNIPKSAKVEVGDSVISSGLTTSFPKGLLIGRVKQVIKESANNNFRILLTTAANFYTLELVYGIENTEAKAIEEVLMKLHQQTNN